MKEIRSDKKIDVRDLIAPISLLMMRNKLAKMTPGQVVQVLCADQETKEILTDILQNSKDRCLSMNKIENHFVFLIEKGS